MPYHDPQFAMYRARVTELIDIADRAVDLPADLPAADRAAIEGFARAAVRLLGLTDPPRLTLPRRSPID